MTRALAWSATAVLAVASLVACTSAPRPQPTPSPTAHVVGLSGVSVSKVACPTKLLPGTGQPAGDVQPVPVVVSITICEDSGHRRVLTPGSAQFEFTASDLGRPDQHVAWHTGLSTGVNCLAIGWTTAFVFAQAPDGSIYRLHVPTSACGYLTNVPS